MKTNAIRRATLTALVFTALAGVCAAETTPPPATPPGHDRPAMRQRGPMGGMMHMLGLAEMRAGMKIEFSEGRIAFLKAELKITDAQAKAWDAFAATLRDNAAKLNDAYATADRDAFAKLNPAERLAWTEKSLAARLDAVKRAKAAFEPLYAALGDEQKKTFDRLVPTGGRWAGMRERMQQRMQQRRGPQSPPPGQPGQPPRQ